MMVMFFFVLTIVTILTNMDIDSAPRTVASTYPIAVNDAAELKLVQKRKISSLGKADSLSIAKDFFCNNAEAKSISNKINQNMVILNFHICLDAKQVDTVAIENVSNGFKAHIFKIEDNKFKTDYIQLNNGVNILKLEAVLKDGQKIEDSLEILSGS